ncbi:DUF3807 domain-containing protein [Aspergillus puulaauensis]|uniref:Uncharacterized protein n=1 Tax=Aspergillus puulaauensis TaxID=1220207 RepID=A0A7R7XHA8_9EURO|nr:uncharacterized protein APUU_21706S [Aspergillus puulaauensis]BCS21274.1 hypothetical protein APUU_21706S [Aspergillus puulaauensis]
MTQKHVPPVTLEDLQAFQAKHFPDPIKPPTVHPVVNQTDPNTSYEKNHDVSAEDDLGYYPDGVKRTLTDEQIRIFRHSEIHSLLRERQIKAENEEYERKFGDKAQAGPGGQDAQEGLEKKTEALSASHGDQAELETKAVAGKKRSVDEAGSNSGPGSSEPVAKKQSTAPADVYLDYNEDEASVVSRSGHGQTAAPQFARRRIISYDD